MVPLSYFLSYGVPAVVVSSAKVYYETKSSVASGFNNVKNLSTGCLLGSNSDSALKSCQKSLGFRLDEVTTRYQNVAKDMPKEQQDLAFTLNTFWKQQQSGLIKDEAQLSALKEAVTATESKFTESQLAFMKSAQLEIAEIEAELNYVKGKQQVNYYIDKAKKSGLTEDDNRNYEAQKQIINNYKGGK